MDKIIQKVESSGWFGGELQIDIKIKRCFEGYHGKASETWETEYSFDSKEIKTDGGNIIIPEIHEKSKRFENFNDFIKRIEEKL